MNAWDLQSRHNLNSNERRWAAENEQRGHINAVPIRFPRLTLDLKRFFTSLRRIVSARPGKAQTA